MKDIELKRLELRNFKGIKKLDIDFKKITDIRGRNGSGKTSIFDAFTWLMFGKDSQNTSNFKVKTQDENGEDVHGLEHSVEGILAVDGKVWKLKRTIKENWVKKKGSIESTFAGNPTTYEINDVPVKESEYKAKINEFVDENVFKLITNPLFFSFNIDWSARRTILMEVLGDIRDEQVISYKSDLEPLRGILEDKTIDDLKKQIKASKAKINDSMKAIPVRIDEISNSIKDLHFGEIEMGKRRLEKKLDEVQEALRSNSGMDENKLKIKDDLYDLKNRIKDFEYNFGSDHKVLKAKLQDDLQKLANEKTE